MPGPHCRLMDTARISQCFRNFSAVCMFELGSKVHPDLSTGFWGRLPHVGVLDRLSPLSPNSCFEALTPHVMV